MKRLLTLMFAFAATVWPLQAQEKPYRAPKIWDQANKVGPAD